MRLELDLFAATWLEQWTALGASVSVGAKGHVSLFVPEYQSSIAYRAPADDVPQSVQDRQHQCNEARFDGEVKALRKMLETMPNGWAAVAGHVAMHPTHVYADGRRDWAVPLRPD